MRRLLLLAAVLACGGADFKDVDPNVFPKDDPRAKDLPKMMWADATKRLKEANLRESKAFAAVGTKAEWEKYRDVRIKALRESLGAWPDAPKDMRVKVTLEIAGDGFVIRNVVYESRPGLWVTANLYLPAKVPAKMPGVLISHAHHTPKTQGELQDMGMTWARAGTAVLVPDHLGYGERRQHDFHTEKDYDKPFRASRQDYYFRYNSNLQLSAAGDSLMGWMVWDLMRGVDVLLKQTNIDKEKIILLGAVAGGGDPAGVTAALDPRVACVIPFNFGGWQPESSVLENPDRDFAWFGEGYWESTRGLKNGARDGFAHFVIVGSVAPRKVIYAHEFAWDAKTDPAWPRLQKVFGFYDAKDALRVAHGAGSVRDSGPGNTHCTHVGAVHRKMIYPALKEWFGMPIPEEYTQRRTRDELTCWTDEAKAELKPKMLHELIASQERANIKTYLLDGVKPLRARWGKLLGGVEPVANPKVHEGRSEGIQGGTLTRFALDVEPGIVVPLLLISPKDVKNPPVVVMVAQAGKAAFLTKRADVIAAFLKSGVAVCLPDVRGTGETQAGSSADRGSARTSISQTNLILGQPVVGMQLRDLRTVIRWLQNRKDIDGKRVAVWGDSFADSNARDAKLAVPLEAGDQPAIAEPGGANLALLAELFETDLACVYAGGGLEYVAFLPGAPYFYLPHEALVPAPVTIMDAVFVLTPSSRPVFHGVGLSSLNQPTDRRVPEPAVIVPFVIDELKAK